MNKNLMGLIEIAGKRKKMIIGLMSGTSLDGLDVALCEIKGHGTNTRVKLKRFVTKLYDKDFKEEIRKVFAKKTVNLRRLCLLNEWVGEQHALIVSDCLKEWKIDPSDVDLLASHGQTIYHAPRQFHRLPKYGNRTLQIGDGDHLALKTGIITISDFRQKHIAAGGEGAPLAAYGDRLLFTEKDANVILLNIGGISNLSFLPLTGRAFSSDIGPGNTLMDAWTKEHFPGSDFDKNGLISKKGGVDKTLLSLLKDNDFFSLPHPRTTGPELFNYSYIAAAINASGKEDLPAEDIMATLTKFSADVITGVINSLTEASVKTNVYVSGGGIHNPVLMGHLKKNLAHADLHSTTQKGIDPDAKEAILFAILANECICGEPATFQKTGIFPAVSMGKISFPS